MKFATPIIINNCASVSPLGDTPAAVWQSMITAKPKFSGEQRLARLTDSTSAELETLAAENRKYARLDRAVLMAILTARKLCSKESSHNNTGQQLGINIGSARGATNLWEDYHQQHLNGKKLSPYSSPTTTAGNLASWVARDLGSQQGLAFSHSVTCSTGLHAIVNAAAWLLGGFSERVIAGGSESALTSFTVAQMQALGLWSQRLQETYSCLPLGVKAEGENTLLLGEACALFDLEIYSEKHSSQPQVVLESCGFANETLASSATSISSEGSALALAMHSALAGLDGEIDLIVAHSPGSHAGDLAELQAIKNVFESKKQIPLVTTNKHLIGHTFAASGPLSLELALLMLQKQETVFPSYELIPPYRRQSSEVKLRRVLVNSTGFGGNAVSVVVRLVA